MADWINVLQSESQWIQCTKCGDIPRGQPPMYCTHCKAPHNEWSPNPMGLIIAHRQQYAQTRSALQAQLEKNAEIDRKLAEAEARRVRLRTARDGARGKVSNANAKAQEAELQALKKSPEAAAAAKRQCQAILDEVEGLATQAAAAAAAAGEAEGRLAVATSELAALEDQVAALDAEVVGLRSENSRSKDLLVDVLARRAAGAAPPGIGADVWAHIVAAQNQQRAAAQAQAPAGLWLPFGPQGAVPAAPQYPPQYPPQFPAGAAVAPAAPAQPPAWGGGGLHIHLSGGVDQPAAPVPAPAPAPAPQAFGFVVPQVQQQQQQQPAGFFVPVGMLPGAIAGAGAPAQTPQGYFVPVGGQAWGR